MILTQIRNGFDSFSGKQKRVAAYILDEYDEVAFQTVEKVAENSDVSEATVIRFARRLGYERYTDFQTALRKEIRNKLSQMERFERTEKQKDGKSMLKMMVQCMRMDINSIEQTISLLKEKDVVNAVDWIINSRKVYVVGSHGEYGGVCYFASTLGWIREDVILIDETHNPAFDKAAEANEKDVVIANSFPPYPAMTVKIQEYIHNKGAKSIAVTDSPLSPLVKHADCIFYPHDEKIYFSDNIAPAVSLFSGLLAIISKSSNVSSKQLKERQSFWEAIHFYYKENDVAQDDRNKK